MTMLDLFAQPEVASPADTPIQYDASLSQFMTPSWAAEMIVQHALPKFETGAVVIEPSAGIGRFLDALPDNYRGIGVEIDPKLAQIAQGKGHEVHVGDFRSIELPVGRADCILGNPPFEFDIFDGFLDRSHKLLDHGGQVVMLLPAYFFQTAGNVVRWNREWSLSQEMMPRNLFCGLKLPLMLARFTKDRQPSLSGLILYHETAAINDMPKIYRTALAEGRSGWAACIEQALRNLGGSAPLQSIYREIEPRRPTANKFWREKIRQVLQQRGQRAEDGRWKMAA